MKKENVANLVACTGQYSVNKPNTNDYVNNIIAFYNLLYQSDVDLTAEELFELYRRIALVKGDSIGTQEKYTNHFFRLLGNGAEIRAAIDYLKRYNIQIDENTFCMLLKPAGNPLKLARVYVDVIQQGCSIDINTLANLTNETLGTIVEAAQILNETGFSGCISNLLPCNDENWTIAIGAIELVRKNFSDICNDNISELLKKEPDQICACIRYCIDPSLQIDIILTQILNFIETNNLNNNIARKIIQLLSSNFTRLYQDIPQKEQYYQILVKLLNEYGTGKLSLNYNDKRQLLKLCSENSIYFPEDIQSYFITLLKDVVLCDYVSHLRIPGHSGHHDLHINTITRFLGDKTALDKSIPYADVNEWPNCETCKYMQTRQKFIDIVNQTTTPFETLNALRQHFSEELAAYKNIPLLLLLDQLQKTATDLHKELESFAYPEKRNFFKKFLGTPAGFSEETKQIAVQGVKMLQNLATFGNYLKFLCLLIKQMEDDLKQLKTQNKNPGELEEIVSKYKDRLENIAIQYGLQRIIDDIFYPRSTGSEEQRPYPPAIYPGLPQPYQEPSAPLEEPEQPTNPDRVLPLYPGYTTYTENPPIPPVQHDLPTTQYPTLEGLGLYPTDHNGMGALDITAALQQSQPDPFAPSAPPMPPDMALRLQQEEAHQKIASAAPQSPPAGSHQQSFWGILASAPPVPTDLIYREPQGEKAPANPVYA